MNILEEKLLDDIDTILLEEYPPIFMQLDKKVRDIISNIFAVGPNSKQIDISKEKVREYDDGLIIGTDEEFTPIGYMIGTNIGKLPTSPYDIGDIDSRPKFIKKSSHLFYISPDEKGFEKIEGREKRGAFEKPQMVPVTRGTKKRYVSKEQKEEFAKRIDRYIEKKTDVYKNMMDLIKKNLAIQLEKSKKSFIEKVKEKETDFDKYTYNKKYVTIVNKIKSFDDIFDNFKTNYKTLDQETINNNIKNISEIFEKLKHELKTIK